MRDHLSFGLHVDRLADPEHDVLDALEVPDAGPGTLLDRGRVYGCSEYSEGFKHGVSEMPVVFAGGANGAMTSLPALGIETPSFGFNGGETTEAIGG